MILELTYQLILVMIVIVIVMFPFLRLAFRFLQGRGVGFRPVHHIADAHTCTGNLQNTSGWVGRWKHTALIHNLERNIVESRHQSKHMSSHILKHKSDLTNFRGLWIFGSVECKYSLKVLNSRNLKRLSKFWILNLNSFKTMGNSFPIFSELVYSRICVAMAFYISRTRLKTAKKEDWVTHPSNCVHQDFISFVILHFDWT